MKLIIDIPERMLDWIKNGFPDEEDMNILIKLVLDGIPLDKIRAEIEQAKTYTYKIEDGKEFTASADNIIHPNYRFYTSGLNKALEIIDKYKAESEDKE